MDDVQEIPGQFFTKSIPAGAVVPLLAIGRNFWVFSSPVRLEIAPTGAPFGMYDQGSGMDRLPGDRAFSRLEIRNTGLVDASVIIYVGGPLFRDSRLNLITGGNYVPTAEPASDLKGANVTSIAAGASLTLTGTPAGTQFRRAAVIIANTSATLALSVYDSSNALCDYVLPSSRSYIPVSGQVKIANDNGAAVPCAISEVWFRNP